MEKIKAINLEGLEVGSDLYAAAMFYNSILLDYIGVSVKRWYFIYGFTNGSHLNTTIPHLVQITNNYMVAINKLNNNNDIAKAITNCALNLFDCFVISKEMLKDVIERCDDALESNEYKEIISNIEYVNIKCKR